MNIPLVDLKAQYAAIGPELRAAVEQVLANCQFIAGPDTAAFEKEFAEWTGAARAATCSNGTSALYLALAALGVGPGDEVVTTPMTFIATTEAVRFAGAKVVLADVRADDLLMDPAAVEAAVTPRTKAIVAVHLYGQPCDMKALRTIAAKRSIRLVEDAAQAHGATFGGAQAGTLGDAASFSFFPGKNLGAAGDGGAITTGDAALAERCAMLRDHGRKPSSKYEHDLEGFNFRLSTIQAAVLRVKLRHLRAWVGRRQALAADLDRRIEGLPLRRVRQHSDRTSAHHLYVVRVADRDGVLDRLKAAGVGAGIHYPVPLHLQPAYASMGWKRGQFPESEKGAAEVLSLPLYPEMTEAQVDAVVKALGEALRGR